MKKGRKGWGERGKKGRGKRRKEEGREERNWERKKGRGKGRKEGGREERKGEGKKERTVVPITLSSDKLSSVDQTSLYIVHVFSVFLFVIVYMTFSQYNTDFYLLRSRKTN